ncbi:MAG: amidoligase family protein [Bacilli bacterium]|nr:amidoligase family protein [Bacilli bacterium]
MIMQDYLNRKNIDKRIYIPFGLEIEMEGIEYEKGFRALSHKITDDWKVTTDRSLIAGGIELVSPVLDNTKESITRLKKISSTLDFFGATFERASFQLNFDAYNLSNNDIIYLLKIFSIYENVIYRFSTGINESMRSSISYALPISSVFSSSYKDYSDTKESYDSLINNKSFALSLKTLSRNNNDPIKVIEFRTPNGTSNFYLWMNYIVFFSSLLTTIINKKYDAEYIDYIFLGMNFFQSMEEMLKVDEKRAKELADLIFNCEEEKDIFYSQYFDKIVRTRK